MGQRITNFISSLKQLTEIPGVAIDGATYVLLALFMFLQQHFGSDDAAKFFSPVTLFYLKGVIGGCSAVLLAIKLFRSTAFAEHRKVTGETDFLTKPNAPKI